MSQSLASNKAMFEQDPEARSIYLDASGNPWPLGHKLKNPAYADTVRKIAAQGPAGLLAGEVGQAIVDRVRDRYPAAKIVIAGMMMPPSMGQDYARAFAAVYPALAQKNQATLLPFLLAGVGGQPALNQGDAIHPNPAGHAVVAATVWQAIQPLLQP